MGIWSMERVFLVALENARRECEHPGGGVEKSGGAKAQEEQREPRRSAFLA
jgi:hypothetical protein